MTALHLASKGGYANVCDYLLKVGATMELDDQVRHKD